MVKLIKVDNEWVRVEDWLRQRAERLERKEKEKEVEPLKAMKGVRQEPFDNYREAKPEVKYNDIPDVDFRGDAPIEVNKLSRKWQDKVTLSEDLRELRALLGWPLYQEWLKETITG